MKKIIIEIIIILSILTFSSHTFAQYTQADKKSLESRSIKEARKEAKKYKKLGFYVAIGEPQLDKQLEHAWMMQLEQDERGYPTYLIQTGTSVAESQIAAKIQATQTAKLFIAGSITTKIAANIETKIANKQMNAKEAASVTEIVVSSKSIIAQKLGKTVPIFEVYRDTGDNVEAIIRLAYSNTEAKKIAKEVIRQKLRDKASQLEQQVDGLLDF